MLIDCGLHARRSPQEHDSKSSDATGCRERQQALERPPSPTPSSAPVARINKIMKMVSTRVGQASGAKPGDFRMAGEEEAGCHEQ
jgi:hypothetical protein